MGGLIYTEPATTREGNINNMTPILFLNLTNLNIVVSHLQNESMDVVTNQKEFLAIVLIRGVHGQFCGRQPENEPAFTGVYMGKL
jgi:3-methyladenine DNA glycosylase Mpg